MTRPTPAVFRKYSADQLEVPENSNTGQYKSRQQRVSSTFACMCIMSQLHSTKKVLLTNISDLICHHVFVVVDSGVWNISLVAPRHNVQFLKSEKKIKIKKELKQEKLLETTCLALTIWTLIPCSWLSSAAND